MRITNVDGAEFYQGTPENLLPVATVAQSLDNQWMDSELLRKTLKAGKVTRSIEAARRKRARAEYLRAVLNAEQVVINRAFFYNNPEVFRDFIKEGPEKDAFLSFLNESVVVPFLMGEASPLQTPRPTQTEKGFSVMPRGWKAWCRVAQESRMTCIRLSWDDDENEQWAEDRLRKEYQLFTQGCNQLAAPGLERDFNLSPEEAREFREHLKDVAALSFNVGQEDKYISREQLYERYIVVDGTPVAERRYDANKPFVGHLKQLIDLKYNTNLGDALEIYSLTPSGSLRRSALQEWKSVRSETGDGELVRLLQHLTFEAIQGLLEDVPTLEHLELSDVLAVRRGPDWRDYRNTLAYLLEGPSFETFVSPDLGVPAVVASYERLMREAEKVSLRRRQEKIGRRVSGIVEISIDVGWVTFNALYTSDGALYYEVAGNIGKLIAKRVVTTSVRLGIGRVGAKMSSRRVDNTVRILQARLHAPHTEAIRLLEYLENNGKSLRPSKNATDMDSEAA